MAPAQMAVEPPPNLEPDGRGRLVGRSSSTTTGDIERGLGEPCSPDGEDGPVASFARRVLGAIGIEESLQAAVTLENPLLLQVSDISFDHGVEPKRHIRCADELQVEGSLKSLPLQEANTARIFICDFDVEDLKPHISEPKSLGNVLFSHLRDVGLEYFETPSRSEVSNISKLAPQWQETQSPTWLGVSPLDPDEYLCVYMKCFTIDTNKLIALYIFSGNGSKELDHEWRSAFLALVHRSSCFQHSNGTRKEFAKLLVLDFLKLSLKLSIETFDKFIQLIQDDYEAYGYQTVDYTTVESHNIEHSRYESRVDAAQDLIDAIEFVISSIINSRRAEGTWDNGDRNSNLFGSSVSLQDLFEETRNFCTQMKKQAARIQAYNQRRYELYFSTYSLHESQGIKRLTALATVFLPLSLGASLLGMQTRFAELGYLMYDFVGVGLLLLLVMCLMYILSKLLVQTKLWKPFGRIVVDPTRLDVTQEEAKTLRTKAIITKIWHYFWNIFVIVVGVYITVTFQVGMFDRVSLGLQMLEYTIPAAIGFLFGLGIFAILFLFVIWYIFSVLRRRRQSNNQ